MFWNSTLESHCGSSTGPPVAVSFILELIFIAQFELFLRILPSVIGFLCSCSSSPIDTMRQDFHIIPQIVPDSFVINYLLFYLCVRLRKIPSHRISFCCCCYCCCWSWCKSFSNCLRCSDDDHLIKFSDWYDWASTPSLPSPLLPFIGWSSCAV